MPFTAGGLALATPDAPLFAGVAVSLYGVVRAVDPAAEPRSALRHWLLAGAAIGVAMASKYTGILVPAGVLAAVVLEPSLRRHLATAGPWLAVAVASLVMSPVLVWNAQHDWISFRFQFQHGFGADGRGGWALREASLALGQIGLVSPILFVLFLRGIADGWRAPRDPRRVVLAAVAAFVLLFFLVSAVRRPVEPNWPAIAWVSAIVLLAAARPGRRTRWERAAAGVAGTLSVAGLVHVVFPYLPLPPQRDASIKAYGWDAVAAQVDSARAAFGDGAPVVAVNRYQDAALLAHHLADRPQVFALNLGSRRNQYDLWPQFEEQAAPGATVLLVLDSRNEPDAEPPGAVVRLAPHFAAVTRGPLLTLARGEAVFGGRRLWVLSGWTGSWPADSGDLPDPDKPR
jgi:4-amino-4-deoxy-L-arabinose transferase-like glycosyltransferase